MKKQFSFNAPSFSAILLTGCANNNANNQQANQPMVGNDRDAHGCIPSAGYLGARPNKNV